MEVTRDWLDSISDDQGLTRGQQTLLNVHCKELPYVGKIIPDNVARFLEKCKGYRKTPAEVKAMRQSNSIS